MTLSVDNIVPLNSSEKVFMYVGSWQNTYGGNDGGGGITVFEVDQTDGSFKYLASYEDKMAVGSIAIARSKNVLYAVNETKEYSDISSSYGGSVSAYSIDPEKGLLTLINKKSTFGVFPCSIAIDPSESYVLVANYGSEDSIIKTYQNNEGNYELVKIPDEGSIVVLPLDSDGKLGDVSDLLKHKQISGCDPIWQTAPHPHSVSIDPTGKYVIVADRGGDTVTAYELDHSVGRLSLIDQLFTEPGTGPRTVSHSPTHPYIFISSELVAEVTAYKYDRDNGKIDKINTGVTIPPNYTPKNPDDFFSRTHPSDIKAHPNGEFVYVLNRGHDSIARFAVEESTGVITYIDTTPSQGVGPREMNFDPSGKYLYVANQGTGNLIVYGVDCSTGELKPTGFVGYENMPASINFFTSSIEK
ncbi:lactonase family protein [Bacillus sp. Marseille-P3661]|uniref:lactonase family protein n=1 Tax=Bacillus sp. Marseille-P3661 TaxID=1936234 RepID=UPI000C85B96F|nr:lactonase family protein [Bacillus sp. Marseille-P3661]